MADIKTVTMKRKADGVVRTFNADEAPKEGWTAIDEIAEGAALVDGDAPKPAKKDKTEKQAATA